MPRRRCRSLSVRTMKSVRQKVSSLSGGQRQTVAIARAVLQKAKVVILDEPTAALGVAQTEQVLALVRRLADAGVGVIIISHNLADVFEVADYINVLYLGAMVAQLKTNETNYNDVVAYITGIKGDTAAAEEVDEEEVVSVTTPVEKSTNPSTDTAAQTVGATAPSTISTGHEGTVRDQIDSYLLRIRGGEMGMLPALAGVVIITVVFFILTPYFLTKTNIANLMTQTAALMMLAVALTFVIILAEIDLSAGVTGGFGDGDFHPAHRRRWVELDRSTARRVGCRRLHRHVHRLHGRQDRSSVVRHHPGPVPGPAGCDPRSARQRRRLPH